MAETFDILNINTSLVKGLAKEGIITPTEVQKAAIPKALKNIDIIVQSETGTGKTLAYLIPLFEKINASSREMQALILVPTHELAIQVHRQAELLADNSGIKIMSAPIIGNVNIDRQIEKLKERPHIIVGSTGRILELIKKKKISAHTIKTIIIDEADRLTDKNNLEGVKAVIKTTLKERQILMYSASIGQSTLNAAQDIMKEPEFIKQENNIALPQTIEHTYFLCDRRDKIEVLRKLIRIINPQKAIVFINKSEEAELTAAKLQYHGIKADCIHGANIKKDRKKTMDMFRSGKICVLIASDIAARGLDIEGVTHVFNLDLPQDLKGYLHRTGRTGRNGNSGAALSIVSDAEIKLIKSYEKAFDIKIEYREMFKGKIVEKEKNPVRKDSGADLDKK
ncbi:superfamily II DNA/RNA helicase [Anaerobacterium chartisolvens]|uniref:Superfamily II DNA/RNA helicase n=1 Tax=Anaerobacterium chartisolvens TaxID=1297424 RepID=A0A369AIX0_9FIRM|nr:DEAD/DEAH box helicase [Anaerobacterium chartisolvens]RCX09111.1 superfamily II DNA/RNA helicase [Anaerobacterium chartisolvens]